MKWQEQIYNVVLGQIQDELTEHIPYIRELIDPLWQINSGHEKSLQDGKSEPQKCRHYLNRSLHILFYYRKEKSSIKRSYHNFLISYRRALDTAFYQSHQDEADEVREISLLQIMALVLYTGIHIQSFQNDLTKSVAKKGGASFSSEDEDHTRDLLTASQALNKVHRIKDKLNRLVPVYHAIKKGKSYLGLGNRERAYLTYIGAVTWASLDLSLVGSLVSIKFRAKRRNGENPLNFIRMSTPTIGSNNNTRINPEFRAYLSYLRSHGLKHTYISYQDNVEPKFGKIRNFRWLVKYFGITNESFRARALEKLSEGDFRNTLQVVTLSKDSSFYLQARKSDRSPTSTRDFVNEFMAKLFDSQNIGYYVPETWREESSIERQEVASLLYELVDILFDNGAYLTRVEKQNVLELAYAFIVDYLGRSSFSLNQTCKDGIDRAGAANALSYIILLVLSVFDESMNEEFFEKHLESLIAMVFSDALLSKKREILKLRLHRFQQAALFLLNRIIARPDIVPRLQILLHARSPVLEWDTLLQIRDPRLVK